MKCKQKDNNNPTPPLSSQDDPSTWQYTRYCEKCDRWLDIYGVDYETSNPYSSPAYGMAGGLITHIHCKGCGDIKEMSHVYSTYWSCCEYCKKRTTSQEVYDKAKPNWKKRFVIAHGQEKKDGELFSKPIINHECLIKCENNQGGKRCDKEWKVTADNY